MKIELIELLVKEISFGNFTLRFVFDMGFYKTRLMIALLTKNLS